VYHAAWSLRLTIMGREDACQDEATRGLPPPVIGNLFELISFEIVESSAWYTCDQNCRLSEPESAWMLRYSAAVALDTSKVISWRPSIDSIPDWEVERRSHQVTLTLAAFQLLQDADIDLRYATSRALSSQFLNLEALCLR
jgi:hypothetical protein